MKKVLKNEYIFAKNVLNNFKNYTNAKYFEITDEEYDELFNAVQAYREFDSLIYTKEELNEGCCGATNGNLDSSEISILKAKIDEVEKTANEAVFYAKDEVKIDNESTLNLDGIH